MSAVDCAQQASPTALPSVSRHRMETEIRCADTMAYLFEVLWQSRAYFGSAARLEMKGTRVGIDAARSIAHRACIALGCNSPATLQH